MELPDVVDLADFCGCNEPQDRGIGSEDSNEVVLGEFLFDLLRFGVAAEIHGEDPQLRVHSLSVVVDGLDVALTVAELLADHHVTEDDHVVDVLFVCSSISDNLDREVGSSSKLTSGNFDGLHVNFQIACNLLIHEFVALGC